jgi:hypothetical protein
LVRNLTRVQREIAGERAAGRDGKRVLALVVRDVRCDEITQLAQVAFASRAVESIEESADARQVCVECVALHVVVERIGLALMRASLPRCGEAVWVESR